MKSLRNIFIISLIIISAGLGMTLVSSHSNDDTAQSGIDGINSGNVIGIHILTLKEGVDPEDFERFIKEEWNTFGRKLFPGVLTTVMKGERGLRIDKYVLTHEFNSIYTRDYYWPARDVQTEASKAVIENCGDKCTKIWERFNSFVDIPEYTDYVGLTD